VCRSWYTIVLNIVANMSMMIAGNIMCIPAMIILGRSFRVIL
jgi:hypothetical protein